MKVSLAPLKAHPHYRLFKLFDSAARQAAYNGNDKSATRLHAAATRYFDSAALATYGVTA